MRAFRSPTTFSSVVFLSLTGLIGLGSTSLTGNAWGQGFGWPQANQTECYPPQSQYPTEHSPQAGHLQGEIAEEGITDDGPDTRDIMDTSQFRIMEYRKMFRTGTTPTEQELVGHWRGVNKGIVELVGYNQFVKEILPRGDILSGDNIMVEQVDASEVRPFGWNPKKNESGTGFERQGKFAIEPPRGIGAFKKGIVFSYRRGGNKTFDPARLLVDKVVKIDDNHLLGRATANFGPLQIPVAYFVLERIE